MKSTNQGKIGFTIIIVAFFAALTIQSNVTRVEKSAAQADQNLFDRLEWQPAPDWILNLTGVKELNSSRGWFTKLFLACAGEEFEAGNVSKAGEVLRIGHALLPDDEDLTFRLGLILTVTKPKEANTFFLDTLFVNETYRNSTAGIASAISNANFDQADSWVKLGKVIANLGEWQIAEVIFNKAILFEPENAAALTMLGLAKEQNGEDGKVELFRAERFTPRDQDVLANIAVYYSTHENYSKAIDYYLQLHNLQPNETIWEMELGKTFALSGDLIKAYEHYVAAIDMQPENVNTWIAMVNFCAQYQIYIQEVGLPAARKAVSLEPDNPDALAVMGMMLFQTGDADSAARYFSRATQLDESNAAYTFYYAESSWLAKNPTVAFNYFIKTIKIAGNAGYGLAARKRLAMYFP